MAKLWLWIVAGVLLLAVLAAALLLLTADGGRWRQSLGLKRATNLALDVRYAYDDEVFEVAPYVGNSEYPLRLDAPGFSFYGKRVEGVGSWLKKAPGPMLYDFVGSMQAEAFEGWYKLAPVGEPLYEDATLGGQLALHQQMQYQLGGADSGWPEYFPASVAVGQQACVEGWALFTERDLFFFYAVSPLQLTQLQRQSCLQVLNSLEFNAVLGSRDAPPAVDNPPPPPPAAGKSDPGQPPAEREASSTAAPETGSQ